MLCGKLGEKAITAVVLGLGLGGYSYEYSKTEKRESADCNFQLEMRRVSKTVFRKGWNS